MHAVNVFQQESDFRNSSSETLMSHHAQWRTQNGELDRIPQNLYYIINECTLFKSLESKKLQSKQLRIHGKLAVLIPQAHSSDHEYYSHSAKLQNHSLPGRD